MTKLHLACASDANYVAHSAAMLHSAITRGGEEVVAHFLHGPGFPDGDARKLQSMFDRNGAEILLHEIPDQQIAGLPFTEMFGAAMWYRVFLPELLPDVDRVLYLDVDTIVVDRLDPLWELELDGHYLAAVTNVFMGAHRHRAAELGIEPADYFNSGVLMFNLRLMREEAFSRAVVQRVVDAPGSMLWPDQDALNLTAGPKRLALHPRWNCMNSIVSFPDLAIGVFGAPAVTEALEMPAIRHFEGPGLNKPWHLLHARAGQRLYRGHRQATPWPNYALEGDTRRNRLKRFAADARHHRAALIARAGAHLD